jgi:hypothetical protein
MADIKSEEIHELALQSQCFQWHWNTKPGERQRLWHVNGKAKNAIEGSKFKAIGVVKGVADLCYMTKQWGTIYIELKTSIGRQSLEQVNFQKQIENCGGIYVICRTFEHFKEIIEFYGK